MTYIPVAAEDERIIWVDVESTGLDPHEGAELLQVAIIVTDGNLEEVDPGFEVKVYHSREDVAAMREATVAVVREMHDATGLWDRLPTEGLPLEEVEAQCMGYLESLGVKPRTARLGGNSITLDRNFLSYFLPLVAGFIHYRSLDMTSVGYFIELNRPDVPQFEKKKTHDAMDDIRESIAEARHYAAALRRMG